MLFVGLDSTLAEFESRKRLDDDDDDENGSWAEFVE